MIVEMKRLLLTFASLRGEDTGRLPTERWSVRENGHTNQYI